MWHAHTILCVYVLQIVIPDVILRWIHSACLMYGRMCHVSCMNEWHDSHDTLHTHIHTYTHVHTHTHTYIHIHTHTHTIHTHTHTIRITNQHTIRITYTHTQFYMCANDLLLSTKTLTHEYMCARIRWMNDIHKSVMSPTRSKRRPATHSSIYQWVIGVCMYVYTHSSIYTYSSLHIYTFIHIRMGDRCVHVCMYTFIHIYIHIHQYTNGW